MPCIIETGRDGDDAFIVGYTEDIAQAFEEAMSVELKKAGLL